MCKAKYVAFLFCLTSTIANAEPFEINRKLQCDTADNIVKILNDFGEKPVWQGKNTNGLLSLLTINPNTKTWSLVITDGDKACLVDAGEGFGMRQNSTSNSSSKNLKEI